VTLKFPKPARRPKRKRPRDPEHLAFLRSLPCCVPGCHNASEAHHVRSAANSGMALKPDDRSAVNLCHAHHMEAHTIGQKTFEAKHAINLAEIARSLALTTTPF
jgi:hypothetical protein